MKQTVDEKCAPVDSYETEDRGVMVKKNAEQYDIYHGTSQEILTSKLELKRVCARWVLCLNQPE